MYSNYHGLLSKLTEEKESSSEYDYETMTGEEEALRYSLMAFDKDLVLIKDRRMELF